MKPGFKLDGDHLNRFELYINALRNSVQTATGQDFRDVTGVIVADSIEEDAAIAEKIKSMERDGKLALSWNLLLQGAAGRWGEFFSVLMERAPDDPRVADLRAAVGEEPASGEEPEEGAAEAA